MRLSTLVPVVMFGGIVAFGVVQSRTNARKQAEREAAQREREAAADAVADAAVAAIAAAADSAAAAQRQGSAPRVARARPRGTLGASQQGATARDLATIQERLREGSPGTYILHMLEDRGHFLQRWPDRSLEPLRVWIQPEASLPDWSPAYPLAAERAFDEWRDAGFPMRFDRVIDSATADIKILFVGTMDREGRIGVAQTQRDTEGWIVEGRIAIATHSTSGYPLSPDVITGTARHEVGHILGLGHSDSPTDVMYPESRTPVISAADRATLHLLYLLPPGPVR